MESNFAHCHWINLELFTVSCHKQLEKLLLLVNSQHAESEIG